MIDLPGGLSCLVVGEGPPLVMFPGMARSTEHRPVRYLPLARATGRRIHVVDRPGTMPRGITMAALAALHADALKALFPEPVHVIGVSTGGAIALQLAVDHPDRVSGLIVAAAASWLGDQGRRYLRQFGDEIERGRTGARILATVLAPPAWRWLATALIWISARRERHIDPSAMLATIDAECGYDVRDRLADVKAPTLFIAGARDRAMPVGLVEAAAAGIKGSRLIVYPRAGHVGTMIHPRFGSDVAAFLASAPVVSKP